MHRKSGGNEVPIPILSDKQALGSESLTLGGKVYSARNLALFAVLPHPDRKRYVDVLTGRQPDTICWGSHAGLELECAPDS